jgi:hypothetical protein
MHHNLNPLLSQPLLLNRHQPQPLLGVSRRCGKANNQCLCGVMNWLWRLLINNMRMELVRLFSTSSQVLVHIISSFEVAGFRQVLPPPFLPNNQLICTGQEGTRCETYGPTLWFSMGDIDIDDIIDIETFIPHPPVRGEIISGGSNGRQDCSLYRLGS